MNVPGGVAMRTTTMVRTAALVLAAGLCTAGQAGGVGVGVVVPVAPMSAVVGVPFVTTPAATVIVTPIAPALLNPVAPVFAPVFQPQLAPAFVPAFTPGFVPVTTIPVTTVPVTTVPVIAAPAFFPQVPVMTPGTQLFFAPPAGGPIIIFRGSGF